MRKTLDFCYKHFAKSISFWCEFFFHTFSVKTCSFSYWIAWTWHIDDAPRRKMLPCLRKRYCKTDIKDQNKAIVVLGETNSPHQSKNEKFLRIKWKFGCKVCSKNGGNGVSLLKPNGQQTEYSCTAYGSEKPTPIITYSKIGCCYFDAEQYTYEKCKTKMK